MEEVQFRKLSIDLPGQPIYDQRPWFWAGSAFAIAILMLIAGAYIRHRKQLEYPAKEKISNHTLNKY